MRPGIQRPLSARSPSAACMRNSTANCDSEAPRMVESRVADALPTYADVEAAAGRLAGVAHKTPVLTSRTVDAQTGARVFFKCENLQRMGAFKFRGAYNALSQLSPEARRRGVLTFSSGN